jgi:hypothetical protein
MNLVRNQDAVDRALAAHRNVRLLSEKSMGFLSPCGITTFPSEKLRDELTNFLAGQSAGPGRGGRTGAFLAGEVLSAQFPDKVTEFVLDNCPSASALPAGVPVVDHLRAFLSETSGFDRLTVAVDKIRSSRLPAEDVSVKEVILGKSTPGEFLAAANPAWLRGDSAGCRR